MNNKIVNKPKIVWKPFPGSQTDFLACPADEILYHGTRGPGKTAAQLMKFMKYVGKGYGSHWKGLLIDRQYNNLQDIVNKTKELFPLIYPSATFKNSKGNYEWTFPEGETLIFRQAEKLADYSKFHGQEFPFLAFNELTYYGTPDLYDAMKSINRSGFSPKVNSPRLTEKDIVMISNCDELDEPYPDEIQEKILPDIPLIVISTSNPSGPGHTWVKRRFIDAGDPGEIVKKHTEVYNPRNRQKEMVTTTQCHIFGSYKENIYLDPKYIADLENIKDLNKKKAWLGGDWGVTAGGALDDLWRSNIHVLPQFIVPEDWEIKRSFDWGSTHPFSVGFWAISNGENITIGSKVYNFKRGSRIRIAEIYGVEHVKEGDGVYRPNYGSNKGMRLSAKEIARQINDFEEEMIENGWVSRKFSPGPADGQIYAVNEASTKCIADMMKEEGIEWYPADKSPGTRKIGLEIIRNGLENAVNGEGAGLYVTKNCEAFIQTVPPISRDPRPGKEDDVDTTSEDHVYDEVRYMMLDDKQSFVSSANLLTSFAR